MADILSVTEKVLTVEDEAGNVLAEKVNGRQAVAAGKKYLADKLSPKAIIKGPKGTKKATITLEMKLNQ